MPPRRRITDEDAALFRAAVSGARPLRTEPAEPPAARPPPARPRTRAVAQAVSEALMPDGLAHDAPGFGERHQFARDGVATRTVRRLARGQLHVADELDLHGMRVDEARRALSRFLDECAQRRLRCVRLVTGKGYRSRAPGPVLKGHVDRWLKLRPEVLAFCSAPQRDGGTGALLVLLRSPPGR